MPHPTEFFSKEFILKLYRELRDADTQTKVQFTLDYIDTVREDFAPELVEYMTKTQLATIYFDHQEYEKALPILEEINQLEIPENTNGSHLYSLLLIQTHRLLKNFSQAFILLEENLISKNEEIHAFETLDFLKEYAQLCKDANWTFDPTFEAFLTKVILHLGFPDKPLKPMEKIAYLAETNRIWNIRLGQIQANTTISEESRVELLKIFQRDCPIRWYRELTESWI
ncbi:hypothetical protein [Algoriphagus taiwanensis]|uniref:Tetratricopeptide repeat protein n=1 Tax=Algoriphagus taiwanensis TaxID=1445656 RepID=A0ABQ6PZK1_9BACT|nr:hypothetical protein Ataiwa_13030 [Algoriphagus taiwanensis]